jgi:hypothetical protein
MQSVCIEGFLVRVSDFRIPIQGIHQDIKAPRSEWNSSEKEQRISATAGEP